MSEREIFSPEDVDALTEIIKRGDLDGMMSASAMAQIIADRWRPTGLQEQPEPSAEPSEDIAALAEDVATLAEIIGRGDLNGMVSNITTAQIIADRWRPTGLQQTPKEPETEWPEGKFAWVTGGTGTRELSVRQDGKWVNHIYFGGQTRGIHDKMVTDVQPIETTDERQERENDDLRRQLSEQRRKIRNKNEEIDELRRQVRSNAAPEPSAKGDYLQEIDRGRDIILGNFNPGPHGGSWRLNPSQAIRDLIEAGWQPPSKTVVDDGAIKLLRSENERLKARDVLRLARIQHLEGYLRELGYSVGATEPSPLSAEANQQATAEVIKGLQGRIDYLKERHKSALAGWHRDKRAARERIDQLSKELVGKDDYILECEQRIVAKNSEIEHVYGKANRRKARIVALEHDQQELLRDYGRVAGRLDALIGKIKDLAEQWRYKGEFGDGPWQEGYGPDETGQALDDASSKLRNLLKETRRE